MGDPPAYLYCSADEVAQLRLESDRNLVQIITIHKAKGREFPFVFGGDGASFAVPPDGAAADLIRETGAGVVAIDGTDIDSDLQRVLNGATGGMSMIPVQIAFPRTPRAP